MLYMLEATKLSGHLLLVSRPSITWPLLTRATEASLEQFCWSPSKSNWL